MPTSTAPSLAACTPSAHEAFAAEVVPARSSDWDRQLAGFLDATIYQTVAYGIARWGIQQVLPVRILRGQQVVAMALVRAVRVPWIGGGIAYLGWGPAWHPRGTERDPCVLRQALLALKRLLVEDGGFHLRVVPNLNGDSQDLRAVFEQTGFTWSPHPSRTILVELSSPLEEIRSGLRRRWRQTLAKAERNPIEVRLGTDVALYDAGLRLFDEMHERKGFAKLGDLRAFRQMQIELPDELKMQIVVCCEDGQPVAALAWSAIGETGVPLLAATGARALENGASYIMWWRMIEWLKLHDMRYCDLGGISQERNPGGYIFKTGLAETHGRQVEPLGDFDAYRPGLGHWLFLGGKGWRDTRVEMARRLARWRRSRQAAAERKHRAGTPLAEGRTTPEAPRTPARDEGLPSQPEPKRSSSASGFTADRQGGNA